jgi:prefoldin subunit 5
MTSISSYVNSPDDVEPTLRRFQEMIAKYQFMEANVQKRAAGLREKLPEMESTLSTIRFLRKKKTKLEEEDVGDEAVADLETTFSLSDTLYAKAKITPRDIDEVYLWLGANVMVAYPLGGAEDMLQGRVEKARETLQACEEDMEFLRVQITTVEVATARVYNWDVVEKRKRKAQGKETGVEEEEDEKATGGG